MTCNMTIAVLTGLLACVGTLSAHADIEADRANGKFTCPGKAATQDWMFVYTNATPAYCKLSVSSSNKIAGDCFVSGEPEAKLKASGSLKVNNKCEVTGSLTLSDVEGASSTGLITANMTKSQTTIIGIAVNSKGSDKGRFGTFTAIRMEQ